MGRVISLRLNETDDARLSGAAALNGLSISAYIKWLVASGKSGRQSNDEMILHRLDELATSVAEVRGALGKGKAPPAIDLPPRSAIAMRLKERGLPSSTIRQVEAVLDELDGKAARTVSSSCIQT